MRIYSVDRNRAAIATSTATSSTECAHTIDRVWNMHRQRHFFLFGAWKSLPVGTLFFHFSVFLFDRQPITAQPHPGITVIGPALAKRHPGGSQAAFTDFKQEANGAPRRHRFFGSSGTNGSDRVHTEYSVLFLSLHSNSAVCSYRTYGVRR